MFAKAMRYRAFVLAVLIGSWLVAMPRLAEGVIGGG